MCGPRASSINITWRLVRKESLRPTQTFSRQIAYDSVSVWNLKKWYKWTYLQNRNRVTDVENKRVSVQFSRSVVSYSLRSHELERTRRSCPSPTPGAYPNSCSLSRWCHPTISSSVIPFSSYPQSFPALGSFQMSQLFTSGGQSIGVSASASVLPMNTQDWFPLGLAGLISLLSKELSTVFYLNCNATFLSEIPDVYLDFT